jgi:hypothetical protein
MSYRQRTAKAAIMLAAVSGAVVFSPPGSAQAERDPSIHRPVTQAELDRLKRQIAEQTRSSVEVLGDYRRESGDLDNRLDLWRLGARLNLRWAANSIVYLSGLRTQYMTRDDRFDGQGTNFTLGLRQELSDALRMQLELGRTNFSTDTSTVNALGSLTYAPSDTASVHLTGSRSNVEESLLSATGLRPTAGPFAGELVGRVMENRLVVGGAVKLPYKIDAFADAGFATREGENIGSNSFEVARAGVGYEVLSDSDGKPLHFLRVGFLWHYFSFDEDRLGFGGASLGAEPLGSDGISPVPGPGNPGVGGYFSPRTYTSRTGRLDFAGRLAPERTYRASAFFGNQVYTDSPKRRVYGGSFTLEQALSERISLPITLQRDNLGPFTQLMLSAKLVIQL